MPESKHNTGTKACIFILSIISTIVCLSFVTLFSIKLQQANQISSDSLAALTVNFDRVQIRNTSGVQSNPIISNATYFKQDNAQEEYKEYLRTQFGRGRRILIFGIFAFVIDIIMTVVLCVGVSTDTKELLLSCLVLKALWLLMTICFFIAISNLALTWFVSVILVLLIVEIANWFFVYKYVGKIDSDDLKQPILDRTAEISFETPKLVPVVHL